MRIRRLFIFNVILFVFFDYIFSFSYNSDILKNRIPDISEVNSYYCSYYNSLLDSAVQNFVSQLNLKTKASQLFHVSFPNNKYLYNKSCELVPGGYLFFAFNIPTEVDELIRQNIELRNFYIKNQQIPPFYSLDCEGGDVNRLRPLTGNFLSAGRVAQRLPSKIAKEYMNTISKMISSAGFDVNLAPVIEPINKNNISFLGDRSYGTHEQVQKYASIFIEEMISNNVYPVVKHYPGNTNADPHLGLPVLKLTDIEYQDLYVSIFQEFLAEYDVGVLAAHTVVPDIDEKPVCLSEKHLGFIKEFDGVSDDLLLFSDDLLMSALTKNGYPPVESVIKAVEAGIDVVMLTVSNWEVYLNALLEAAERNEKLENSINQSCSKLIKWKCKQGILTLKVHTVSDDLEFLIQIPEPLSEEKIEDICTERNRIFNENKASANTIIRMN